MICLSTEHSFRPVRVSQQLNIWIHHHRAFSDSEIASLSVLMEGIPTWEMQFKWAAIPMFHLCSKTWDHTSLSIHRTRTTVPIRRAKRFRIIATPHCDRNTAFCPQVHSWLNLPFCWWADTPSSVCPGTLDIVKRTNPSGSDRLDFWRPLVLKFCCPLNVLSYWKWFDRRYSPSHAIIFHSNPYIAKTSLVPKVPETVSIPDSNPNQIHLLQHFWLYVLAIRFHIGQPTAMTTMLWR